MLKTYRVSGRAGFICHVAAENEMHAMQVASYVLRVNTEPQRRTAAGWIPKNPPISADII